MLNDFYAAGPGTSRNEGRVNPFAYGRLQCGDFQLAAIASSASRFESTRSDVRLGGYSIAKALFRTHLSHLQSSADDFLPKRVGKSTVLGSWDWPSFRHY